MQDPSNAFLFACGTVVYHFQSRHAEHLTAHQNVSHQNTPPFLSRPQHVLAQLPREKRLRLTSRNIEFPTSPPSSSTPSICLLPHTVRHTLVLLDYSSSSSSTSTSIFSSPHRARASHAATEQGRRTRTSLVIALDSTPRIARSNLTLYREPR